jgi:hypothetical protein
LGSGLRDFRDGMFPVTYQAIRTGKALQPDCVLTDHTHLADPWDVDVVDFEEPSGVFAPATNTFPALQDTKINGTGGTNGSGLPTWADCSASAASATMFFLLNCPPNRDGLRDATIVSRLAGRMKTATFGPAAARYVRFEARAANGASAAATEITVGARS